MRRDLEALTEGIFDLCIIGGGITGAGVALDAATRGWRVALIDKGDFASGTSSASSKLIHGGLRYLEYGQIGLVREALIERGRLLRNAPHLVEALPFVLPFYAGQRIKPWQWRLGMTAYDLLAGRANIARSRPLSGKTIHSILPGLRDQSLLGGALYHDALMDDARLCLTVLHTAARHGVALANYVEAIGFETQAGTIIGTWVQDRMHNARWLIRSRVIVNAAGPWADAICQLAGDADQPRLQPTKGVHVIALSRGHRAAGLLLHPRDGRVFFVIPWQGKMLLGTTDTFPESGPDELQVLPEEIDYLLEGYNHFFTVPLDPSGVMGSFAGLRPLLRAPTGSPSARSREFALHTSASGLVTARGGKYTTFRQMAETIVDLVAHRLGKRDRCRTRDLPLVGTPPQPWREYVNDKAAWIATHFPIAPGSALHLVSRYGNEVDVVLKAIARAENGWQRLHPEEPDLLGELLYQGEVEMAQNSADLLLRRSRVGMYRPELLK